MKKITALSLFIIMLLISSKAFTQTNASGPYFSNTTWNISGSPYNLIGDVQIPNGVSLTVEAGVVINFNSDYEILIKGNLLANGNNTSPIIFNGNINGKSMIIFKDTNLSNSELSFLEFNGPKNAFQLADESEFIQDAIKNSGTLSISNVTFTNTRISTDGYQTTANLLIENSTFNSTNVQGTYPRSESIELKNSNLYNSNVNSDSYNYGIIIDNCTEQNTNFSIGCCGANLEFLESNLIDSTISEGSGNPKVGPVKITQSEFDNTTLNLPAARVESNSSVFNFDGSFGLIFGNGTFECSQISGNNTGTAIKITGYDGYNIGNNVVFSNSTIKDNSIGIDIENANEISISNSNIYNNSSFNIRNTSIENISAMNNWWGSAEANTIESKIYDYYDNINFGIINYSNYLNNLEDISSNCPLLTLSTLNIDNTKTLLYPNPNNGRVNINFGTTPIGSSIKVFNTNGQVIYETENVISQFYQFELNVKSGLYIIQINNYNKTEFAKLIIK